MVSLYWYYGDLGSYEATIEVTSDGEEIPLSVVKLCQMEVSVSRHWI